MGAEESRGFSFRITSSPGWGASLASIWQARASQGREAGSARRGMGSSSSSGR